MCCLSGSSAVIWSSSCCQLFINHLWSLSGSFQTFHTPQIKRHLRYTRLPLYYFIIKYWTANTRRNWSRRRRTRFIMKALFPVVTTVKFACGCWRSPDVFMVPSEPSRYDWKHENETKPFWDFIQRNVCWCQYLLYIVNVDAILKTLLRSPLRDDHFRFSSKTGKLEKSRTREQENPAVK